CRRYAGGSRMNKRKHVITPRKVAFDLSKSPLHWLPGDSFSSHMINGIHLLLPAGELWFCRVYNQALPSVTDDALRQDVRAFIEQEAIHARAHRHGEDWLKDKHGMEDRKSTRLNSSHVS